MSDVDTLRAGWDQAARDDAMFNIVSDSARAGGAWTAEKFFAYGRQEIDQMIWRLNETGRSLRRERALDFGCGMGRLTQALAEYYDHVDGVDVSPEMLKLARKHNRRGKRVRYRLNGPDLNMFEDGRFDLVYSMIVLQHMPPKMQERYVTEFVRVLSDDGAAVFELPDCADLSNGHLSMYGTKPKVVEDWVESAGATIVDMEPINDGSWRYTAVRA